MLYSLGQSIWRNFGLRRDGYRERPASQWRIVIYLVYSAALRRMLMFPFCVLHLLIWSSESCDAVAVKVVWVRTKIEQRAKSGTPFVVSFTCLNIFQVRLCSWSLLNLGILVGDFAYYNQPSTPCALEESPYTGHGRLAQRRLNSHSSYNYKISLWPITRKPSIHGVFYIVLLKKVECRCRPRGMPGVTTSPVTVPWGLFPNNWWVNALVTSVCMLRFS